MAALRPLALAAAFAAAGALAYAAMTRGPGATPFDAMPAGSFLVLTVDVAALRASPLYTAVFDAERERSWGLGELALACGFDPMSRVRELDVAIPEGGEPGDFGVAASADLTPGELVRCAENVAGARGASRKAVEVGAFHVLEDDKGHALAASDNGPIVVGRATFVRAMIDTAEGRGKGAKDNPDHAELRDALAASDVRGRPLVVVTALLPADLRDRLRREMGAELGAPGSNATMGGILGVRAAGLSVRETGEGVLEARAELRCDSGSACEEVRKLVLARRLAFSQDMALRLVGLGPAIDAFDAKVDGPRLTATTRVRTADLAATLERVQKLRGQTKPKAPPPLVAPAPPPRAAPAPDEVLTAKDAAGGPPRTADAGRARTPPGDTPAPR